MVNQLNLIDKYVLEPDIQQKLKDNHGWSYDQIAERVYFGLAKIGW